MKSFSYGFIGLLIGLVFGVFFGAIFDMAYTKKSQREDKAKIQMVIFGIIGAVGGAVLGAKMGAEEDEKTEEGTKVELPDSIENQQIKAIESGNALVGLSYSKLTSKAKLSPGESVIYEATCKMSYIKKGRVKTTVVGTRKGTLYITNECIIFNGQEYSTQQNYPINFTEHYENDGMLVDGYQIELSKEVFLFWEFSNSHKKLHVKRLVDYYNKAVRISLYKPPTQLQIQTVLDVKQVENKNIISKEPKKKLFDETELKKRMKELNSLIGLQETKEQIQSLVNLLTIHREREKKGMKVTSPSLHFVFSGSPGTGKTTVARLLGGILKSMGFIERSDVVEVDRSGLVAGYVGQTAIKVDEVVKSAIGGVLFIDEAYSLSNSSSGNDYGNEAIETLLKRMEDNRERLVVIIAGYTNKMEQFINANPGLQSRFSRRITFSDYSGEELSKIYLAYVEKAGYKVDKNTEAIIVKEFSSDKINNLISNGNARFARNVFEKTLECHANRVMKDGKVEEKELDMFTEDDIIASFEYFVSHQDT